MLGKITASLGFIGFTGVVGFIGFSVEGLQFRVEGLGMYGP